MAEVAVPDSEEAQGLAGVKTINVRLAQNEDGDDVHGLVLASEQGHPSAREKRDELLPYIDDDIARRVFELTLERSSALH